VRISENKAVMLLSEQLALASGYGCNKAKEIGIAAALHDVGKKHTPTHILEKPEKLTSDEFEIIKQHTKIGYIMLSSMVGDVGKMAKFTALMHHEYFNGKGYWGIPSQKLPSYIGIVSIADVFCALLSPYRPYKQGWPPNEATQYIKEQAGVQFCPELVNIFMKLIQTNKCVSAIFMQ